MALANVFFTRIITGLGGSTFQQMLACRWGFHEWGFQHLRGSISGGVIGYWSRLFQCSGDILIKSNNHVLWDAFLLVLQKKREEVEVEKQAGRPSWGRPWKKFFVLLDPSFSQPCSF